jgi:hypothetical protein
VRFVVAGKRKRANCLPGLGHHSRAAWEPPPLGTIVPDRGTIAYDEISPMRFEVLLAMADPKGQKLFVNLSASQTRKRLKGFGHGVRKIQSAGKNQAVVIHTATGQHLEELRAQFADVGVSDTLHQARVEREAPPTDDGTI